MNMRGSSSSSTMMSSAAVSAIESANGAADGPDSGFADVGASLDVDDSGAFSTLPAFST